MLKGIIKKKIKAAVFELAKALLEVVTTAEYGYNHEDKQFTIKFTKEW